MQNDSLNSGKALQVSIHGEDEEKQARWDRKLSRCTRTTHPKKEDRVNIREDRNKG